MEFYIHCPQIEIWPVHSFDAVEENMHHRFAGSTLNSFMQTMSIATFCATLNTRNPTGRKSHLVAVTACMGGKVCNRCLWFMSHLLTLGN